MSFVKRWNGNVFGTNIGKVSILLDGDDTALTGTLRFADTENGPVTYQIKGSFDGSKIEFAGETKQPDFGPLSLKGNLRSDGSIAGDWETTIGTGGTFYLFPHDFDAVPAPPTEATLPNQLHTKQHNFGPIVIERSNIIALAETLKRELPRSKVVITFTTSTEQARYLEDFKNHTFSNDKVEFLKVHAREPEGTGIDRLITIEFGQTVNFVMTQGSQESWVLGTAEKMKHDVASLQRTYANRQFEAVINQLIVIAAIAAIPSLETYFQRLVLLVGVAGFTFAASWLHKKLLPNAVIYVGEKREEAVTSAVITVGSWIISLIPPVLTALIVAYFKGMLHLPAP